MRVCSEAAVLWVRLVIRTAHKIVDGTSTDHRRQRLLLLACLLLHAWRRSHFVHVAMPGYLKLLLLRHSRLRLHDLYVIEKNVRIRQSQSLRYLVLRNMEHFRVLREGQTAIRAVQVLDEGVSAIARSLRSRLPSSLALFFFHPLAVADSATFFALEICMA